MSKLLVIRLGALGDLIHMSASLAQVKAACPKTQIHVLASPAYQPLVAMMSAVDRCWAYDKKAGWPGLYKLARALRQEGFDAAVNLHPALKTWLLVQLLQPPRQATYRKQKLRLMGSAQRGVPRRHAVADFYGPFQQLLDLPQDEALIPRLTVPPGESQPKAAHERWVAIIPGVGAKRGNRAWLPEAYKALVAQLLAQPEVRILLIGGPDEQALAESLKPTGVLAQRVENHCGRHDIPGTARLLAQCDAVLGGDTGPLHLASAVGVPLVGIYGPTSLDRTGPVGTQSIQRLTPPADLTCWPCELPRCPLTGEAHLACMRQIAVEDVLAAVQRL